MSAESPAAAERGATFPAAKEAQLQGPDPRTLARRGGRFICALQGKHYRRGRTERFGLVEFAPPKVTKADALQSQATTPLWSVRSEVL